MTNRRRAAGASPSAADALIRARDALPRVIVGAPELWLLEPEVEMPGRRGRSGHVACGSLWIVVGEKLSPFLAVLHSSLRESPGQALEMIDGYAREADFAPNRAADGSAEWTVLAEVRYAGQTIAGPLAVTSERQVAVQVVSYPGGKLRPGHLSLTQYSWDRGRTALDALVVARPPSATVLERAVARVQSELSLRRELRNAGEASSARHEDGDGGVRRGVLAPLDPRAPARVLPRFRQGHSELPL